MSETYISKVVFGNQTLIDLTSDTVMANKLLSGYTAHGADGSPITGECNYDAYTSDATANIAEVLISKTYYKNGTKLTGTMPNIGQQTSAISEVDQSVSISQGYHDGTGTVSISTTEQNKIIAENIRQGITILGVAGSMSGSEDVHATTLSVTPYTTAKEYTPSGGYNYYSQVNIAAIAYSTAVNSAGGLTATIGTVAPSS